MPALLSIHPVDPLRADVRAVLAASDAYAASLYPAESNHLEPAEALAAPGVFVVGGFAEGKLVATGAVMHKHDDGEYGEIKRVFVLPEARGRGYSRAVMRALETQLVATGVPTARLETGIHQPEALGLYRTTGYASRQPFGRYRPDPLSVFLEKAMPALAIMELAAPATTTATTAITGAQDDDLLEPLAALLRDTVAAGASIGWVQVPSLDRSRGFWLDVFASVAAGHRRTWVARGPSDAVIGTVSLVVQQPENGARRAEVVKLMVHPQARRSGVAEALMHTAEHAARSMGKHLLLLDTNTDSPAQRLYERRGWQICGVMPDYAIQADGSLGATTWMYKVMAVPGVAAVSPSP